MTTDKKAGKAAPKRTAGRGSSTVTVVENATNRFEQAKATLGNVSQRLDGLRDVGSDALSAARASSAAAIHGVREFDREVRTYSHDSWSEATATMRAVFAAKRLDQVTDIQARYVVARIEGTAECLKSLADISARTGVAMFEPWAKSLGELAARADKTRTNPSRREK